jgi:hypothetical protein
MINWPVGVVPNRYTVRYEKLIENAKNRIFPENEYGEVHHIIPRCFGGLDTDDNKVKLYAREHYIAHLFLWKMSMTPKMHNKMSMALHVMVNGSGNQKQNRDYLISSRIYEQSRKAYIEAIKEHFAEHGGTFLGRKHKPESIQKIIEANIRTRDVRSAKLSGPLNGMYGKKHTEETKNMIKESCTNMWTEELREEQSKRVLAKWQDEDWKKQTLEERYKKESWLNRDWKTIARKSADTKKANGWKPSEESKKKISETRKKKIASGEIVPWNKGKKMSSDYVHSQSKKWEITKPNGEKILFVGNIHDFCKDNKIGYDSLRDLANGKQGKNKLFLLGWKVNIL